MRISRRSLVSGTMLAAAQQALAASPSVGQIPLRTTQDFYGQLIAANERVVRGVLQELASGQTQWPNIRRVGSNIEALAAAFCAPESSLNASAELIAPMEKVSSLLLAAQHSDGTIDAETCTPLPIPGLSFRPFAGR